MKKSAVRDPKFAELRDCNPVIEEYLVKLELKFRDIFYTFAGHRYFFVSYENLANKETSVRARERTSQ